MKAATLHWLPIALPKFPYPEMDFDDLTNYWTWKFKKLNSDGPAVTSAHQLDAEVLQRYPDLADWLDQLPFISMRNVKFNIQRKAMDAHVDFTHPETDLMLYQNNVANEPCGYRAIIKGTRSGKLWLQFDDAKIYPTMPEDTDTYVIRHTDTWHAVDDDPGRRTLFLHLEIDSTAHRQLLRRSLDCYGDYAVYGPA